MTQNNNWLETKNAFVCKKCGIKFREKKAHECKKNKLSKYFVEREIKKLKLKE